MKIGVLGAGQLGRMLALEGYPLGVRFRFLEPARDASAAQLAEHVLGEWDDPESLDRFVEDLDLVTYEFENIPMGALDRLTPTLPVYPPPRALAVAQDRLFEKRLFHEQGVAAAPYVPVETLADLRRAVEEIGRPCVLKTRRFGYDGKGQVVIREGTKLGDAWKAVAERPCVLEQLIRFERELSLVAVRGRDGALAAYPLIENHHREGILRLSFAPAPDLHPGRQGEAEAIAARLLETLDYVGVLTIEFFETERGLLANEIAPRVHNSGHWSIEGAETSQFENHLRAICGFPLGSTAPTGHCAMINIIGEEPRSESVLSVRGAHLHLYNKAPRPGRKLGHVTLKYAEPAELTRVFGRAPAFVPPEAMEIVRAHPLHGRGFAQA